MDDPVLTDWPSWLAPLAVPEGMVDDVGMKMEAQAAAPFLRADDGAWRTGQVLAGAPGGAGARFASRSTSRPLELARWRGA